MRLTAFAVLAAIALPVDLSAAEIWGEVYREGPRGLGRIVVLGDIVEGDLTALKVELAAARENDIIVTDVLLYSRGGDVYEALSVGRQLRLANVTTIAPNAQYVTSASEPGLCMTDAHSAVGDEAQIRADDPNCICASACALIWAGGVERLGRVGLHHPRVGSPSLRFADQERSLSLARNEIRTYLEEMRLPDWFYERATSENSTSLDSVEAFEATIWLDPIFEEYLISRCGAHYTGDRQGRLFDLLSKQNARETSPLEDELLEALKALSSTQSRCRAIAHISAQEEAQSDLE